MTELEAMTRADQIVQHHLDNPLELRSFVAHCLLADARIADYAAIAKQVKALVESVRQAQKDKCNGFDTLASAEWDNITRMANKLREALEMP